MRPAVSRVRRGACFDWSDDQLQPLCSSTPHTPLSLPHHTSQYTYTLHSNLTVSSPPTSHLTIYLHLTPYTLHPTLTVRSPSHTTPNNLKTLYTLLLTPKTLKHTPSTLHLTPDRQLSLPQQTPRHDMMNMIKIMPAAELRNIN